MIYIESSLNSCVFRFLSENDMNIVLIDKIDNNQLKNKFYYDSTEKIFQIYLDIIIIKMKLMIIKNF